MSARPPYIITHKIPVGSNVREDVRGTSSLRACNLDRQLITLQRGGGVVVVYTRGVPPQSHTLLSIVAMEGKQWRFGMVGTVTWAWA